MERIIIIKPHEVPLCQIISDNLELFHKLALLGVKNISTVIDYLSIYETYEKHSWIEKEAQRRRAVASQCKVTLMTVCRALNLMGQKIELR